MFSSIELNLSNCVNIALNKHATQSSFSSWSRPDESGRCINGSKTGGWSFHTDHELEPWWQVDLEESYAIEAIVIWNRDDECASRASKLRIEISGDAERWQMIYQGVTYFGGYITGRPLAHFLNGAVLARYVRISLAGAEFLHLDEVEVFVSVNFLIAKRLWTKWRLPGHPSSFPYPSPFQYAVIGAPNEGRDDGVDALEVVRFERFGNNLHQILNATMVAIVGGVRDIVLFDSQFFDLDRTGVQPDSPRYRRRVDNETTRRLLGTYFRMSEFDEFFKATTASDWNRALVTSVRPLFAPLLATASPAAHDYIFFHFRAGDVFVSGDVHPHYTQPPLSFYIKALEHAIKTYDARKAVLVYENVANPCVGAFRSYLDQIGFPHSTQSASLNEDLRVCLETRYARAILLRSRITDAA